MKNIQLICTVLVTLVLSTLLIISFDHEKMYAKESPRDLYQVYLRDEKIGIIKSKKLLEKYIDNKQQEIKEKYDVKTVYPPKNLYIQKYIGYESNVLSEKEIYSIIKNKEPFTIKGYVVTIKKETPIKINILNKDIFKKAAETTIEAFVPADDFKLYKEDKQPEIKTTGKIIENLAIEPWPVYKEAYIPVDEYIFTDAKELARYLLFGTLDTQRKYTVKVGDTIENIAFVNKLGVEEFLIVNPQFSNPNNLLSPGQEVEVGLINPIFDVVVEEHIVEDVVQKYQTKIVYDPNILYGTSTVKQKGSDGLYRVVQKIQSVRGERKPGYIAGYEVLKAPIDEIIVKGSKTNQGTVVVELDGTWAWPTRVPYIITSGYGWRWGSFHAAIDISGTGHGSPIYAANHGVILRTGYDGTRGNYIVLKHDKDYYTIYLHLSKIGVKVGQSVTRGQTIGGMGSTGYSTGTHLHFGAHIGEPYTAGTKHFNPLLLYR